MTRLTHDATLRSRTNAGLGFAVVSAVTFGTSGTLAKGLLAAGWSPAGAVAARVWIGALVLAVPTLILLRRDWSVLRRHARLIVAYGLVAIAGTQLAYFNAVAHMEVGLALLIEYTAPVVVIGWLWLRHGERPTLRTLLGALVAAAGLVLVLDLFGPRELSALGVTWACLAMLGVASYFVMSAHEADGLSPIVLAGTGMMLGAVALTGAGWLRLIDVSMSTAPATYGGVALPWWQPVLALGVVSAAIAYLTGILAGRRLGSRLTSFVALLEVVAALLFAWWLLGELPTPIQLVGGVLILAGVVLVKLAEKAPTPVLVEAA